MATKHIIVGDEAAKQLIEAASIHEELQGDITVLQDTLGIGPLHSITDESFSTVRTNFWKSIDKNWLEGSKVNDEEKIKTLCAELQDEDTVWFWMAPCVSDVVAYFWLLNYFKAHPGVLHTIFINSLPFFNSKGTLFYPKNFSEVLPSEMHKCRRLVKDVSLADYEVDGDEWVRLAGENANVRSHEGGKKITSRNDHHYDSLLLNQFQFNNEPAKANKVIQQALSKCTETVSDLFFIYRLHTLVTEGKLEAQGDTTKQLKDFAVKLAQKNTEQPA